MGKAITRKLVEELSHKKGEPKWMLEARLEGLAAFERLDLPKWGAELSEIRWGEIDYYIEPRVEKKSKWEEVPEDIKRVFEALGVPEAEKKWLAGVEMQVDSEKLYGSIKKHWEKLGVVFLSMDEGLKQYPEIVREYFGKIVPVGDNKLAALNTAMWSGGSFVYVPQGVEVALPLQAYFYMESDRMGQFERTMIVVEEGARAHYVEGCSAVVYGSPSLHAGVVEVVVKRGARCRYTTVQNWYKNVYNLVTKRAEVGESATMEWLDCNVGCLTGDTKLLSPSDGMVRIDEIKGGQTVYAYDFDESRFVERKVVGRQRMGHKKVWEVVLEGRRLRATGNHPFLTLERRDKLGSKSNAGVRSFVLKWKQLNDLSRGDMVAYVGGLPDLGKPRKLTFHFESKGSGGYVKYRPSLPKQTDERLMWLLGIYLGDGYMERDRHSKVLRRVYFAIPPESRVRGKLEKMIKELLSIGYREKGICVTIGSTAFAQFLQYLGMEGNAHTKRVPKWVYCLPISQRLALLEGCLDSDGHVHKTTHQITFTSASKELLEDLQQLAVSCGLKIYKVRSYTSTRKLPLGKEKKEYTHYQFCISVKDLKRIREHSQERNEDELMFARVSSIEEAGREYVYDIEVEGVHNFVANGILVHNSRVTMKYPSCLLKGEGSHGEMLSIAVAGNSQQQDTGGKMYHLAPNTTSRIVSKSISKDGGRASYRGMVMVSPKAKGSKSKVVCDALILDDTSRSDTYPTNRILTKDVQLEHEAFVSRISEEQTQYLRSRGLTEQEAQTLIVRGFLGEVLEELPMEYAVELNRLVKLEMTNGVG